MLIPAVAGITLLSFLTARDHQVEYDLHLIAPLHAVAGDPLPLRAHLFGDLERPQGPRLLARPVRVELIDGAGAVVARTRLDPGYRGSLEGSLGVPAHGRGGRAAGHWQLRAVADVPGRGGEATRPLLARASELALAPRAVRALGRFAPGPLHRATGVTDPPRLDLRVGGGVCVPEQPCEILVHTGASDVSLEVEPHPSLSLSEGSLPDAGAPVARFWLITHGPEAELTLHALRRGQRVARRRFRLPVALDASALGPLPPLHHAPALPSLQLLGEPGGCIVDAYRGGRWLRSASQLRCEAADPVPFAALSAGLWRLQVRRDPFDTDTAAVRVLRVRAPLEDAADVLRDLARQAARREPDDVLARRVRADPAPYVAHMEPTARYLLCLLEPGLYPQPAPASGYGLARATLAAELGRMRTLALWALALCGVVLVLLVLRRGLAGSSTAERVMRESEAPAAMTRRRRLRALLSVAAAAVSLALAFVAIAIYVIARSMGD